MSEAGVFSFLLPAERRSFQTSCQVTAKSSRNSYRVLQRPWAGLLHRVREGAEFSQVCAVVLLTALQITVAAQRLCTQPAELRCQAQ